MANISPSKSPSSDPIEAQLRRKQSSKKTLTSYSDDSVFGPQNEKDSSEEQIKGIAIQKGLVVMKKNQSSSQSQSAELVLDSSQSH